MNLGQYLIKHFNGEIKTKKEYGEYSKSIHGLATFLCKKRSETLVKISWFSFTFI